MNKDKTIFHRWIFEEKATAFTESVVLLPVMISMLMGCYDLGQGIVINQKTIAASQIIGDLIARERSITIASLEDITTAGEMAFEPYADAPFGYDIVSVQFEDDGDPDVLWRVTENTVQNDDAVASTEALGALADGLVVVTATYRYETYFTNFIVDEINMREVAFLHGRRSATVACGDCPGG